MLSSANKLAKIGADFLICPDNTIHQALPYVEPQSPLPWLHIAEVVATEADAASFASIGTDGHPLARRERGLPGKISSRGLKSRCARTPPNAKKSIA